MSALAFSRWSDDYHLFVLGLLSFIAATIAGGRGENFGRLGRVFT
jgi:hypothetical protein